MRHQHKDRDHLRKDDIFSYERFRDSLDDELFFKAKVDGAYNWLHMAQFLYKRLNSKKFDSKLHSDA